MKSALNVLLSASILTASLALAIWVTLDMVFSSNINDWMKFPMAIFMLLGQSMVTLFVVEIVHSATLPKKIKAEISDEDGEI